MGRWSQLSVQLFLSMPPPLRPSPADLDTYARLCASRRDPGREAHLLVLGSTPDFWELPLPPGSRRLAADRAMNMLAGLWPGGAERGLCTDWSRIPVADASHDLVLCDGGFTMLAFPAQHALVVKEIARVLGPGGLFLLRVHPQPARPECAESVIEDLLSGRIINSSELKLRLAAALCEDSEQGVPLDHAWQVFNRACGSVNDLLQASRWPASNLEHMDTWKGYMGRYTFPALDEQLEVLAPADGPFRVQEVVYPGAVGKFESPIVALVRV